MIPASRLVTLTGAGGSGKTRLALETVDRLRQSGDADVAWVELASLADPGSLASHLALALGVRVEGGGSTEQAVVALLRDRELLLVLDNCEHLVDECARLVEVLLRDCPGLRVLATSREALGVSGERSWLVPPLSLPAERAGMDPEEMLRAESVRLFIDRARDVAPGFTLNASNAASVSRICRRVDGLPLAVELAAARINVLTPEQIAERLDDRFALLTSGSRSALPRHRTLRAAVDWSFDLLSGAERLLLERLSVFAGGFTLTAAERVCAGGEIAESQVLDVLASLVSRSLVAMQEEEGRARYRLLETIREYAAARRRERADLEDTGERHAWFFLALALELEPEIIMGRSRRLQQIDAEHDNVVAALAWSADNRLGSRYGLPLAWALMWYWFHRQLWREGSRHFERALQTAVDPGPELRAAALFGLGTFGLYSGEPQSASRLEEADALWRGTGNSRWLTFTLLVRTVEASLREDPVAARMLAEEAVAVARRSEEPWDLALVTAHALVPVLVWEEDWETAAHLLREAEHVYRANQYAIGVAYVLDARAFVALQQGHLEQAASLACTSLREDPNNQNRWLAGRSLRILAAIAFARGDARRSARLFGAAEGMYTAIGARSLTAERRSVNELPAALKASMPPQEFEAEWEAGRRGSFEAVTAFALEAANEAERGTPADAPATPTAATTSPGPAPLAVRALGPLEIRRNGQPLPADAWRHARPRELLLYLLAHPEGRTREQVGLDFWPDASTSQVKNNFHVTLHHLRRTLGGSGLVLYEADRYRVNFEAGVEFDAWLFEEEARTALRRLRAGVSRGSVDPEAVEAATVLRTALGLYRGPFLMDQASADWHTPIRDRLAQLFLDGLQSLAEFHASRNERQDAILCLRQLVQADGLNEAGVRQLMTALASDGRRGEAIRAFDQFAKLLAVELDATPEPETTRLLSRIRLGDEA